MAPFAVSSLHVVPAESSLLADYLRELQLHRLQVDGALFSRSVFRVILR